MFTRYDVSLLAAVFAMANRHPDPEAYAKKAADAFDCLTQPTEFQSTDVPEFHPAPAPEAPSNPPPEPPTTAEPPQETTSAQPTEQPSGASQ